MVAESAILESTAQEDTCETGDGAAIYHGHAVGILEDEITARMLKLETMEQATQRREYIHEWIRHEIQPYVERAKKTEQLLADGPKVDNPPETTGHQVRPEEALRRQEPDPDELGDVEKSRVVIQSVVDLVYLDGYVTFPAREVNGTLVPCTTKGFAMLKKGGGYWRNRRIPLDTIGYQAFVTEWGLGRVRAQENEMLIPTSDDAMGPAPPHVPPARRRVMDPGKVFPIYHRYVVTKVRKIKEFM